MTDFVVKDSGSRQEFAGGMVRDTQEGKTDYWRIFQGPLAKRYAEHLTKGARKYPDVTPGVPNWTLAAGEEEYQRARQSAVRHFLQWYWGVADEDHFAATVFNMNVAEYIRDRTKKLLVSKVDGTELPVCSRHYFLANPSDPLAETHCINCGTPYEAAEAERLRAKGIGW